MTIIIFCMYKKIKLFTETEDRRLTCDANISISCQLNVYDM